MGPVRVQDGARSPSSDRRQSFLDRYGRAVIAVAALGVLLVRCSSDPDGVDDVTAATSKPTSAPVAVAAPPSPAPLEDCAAAADALRAAQGYVSYTLSHALVGPHQAVVAAADRLPVVTAAAPAEVRADAARAVLVLRAFDRAVQDHPYDEAARNAAVRKLRPLVEAPENALAASRVRTWLRSGCEARGQESPG